MALARRALLRGLLVGLAGLLAPPALAHPGPHPHPHRRAVRRRIRRRVRRRVRRRALWRTVRGRRVLVVPLALAVGWELLVDDRVVVVTEIRGDRVVVERADGSSEEIEVVREDTEDNREELEGSEIEDEQPD